MRVAIRVAALILFPLITGVVGFAVGQRQDHQAMMRLLQIEASGNLTQRIEALSRLRIGDDSGAISGLETEADSLTVSIAGNPGADQRVLGYMKTYLTVAHPSPAREKRLSQALRDVPVLEPGKCDTALKALLLSARKSN
jgi:hypothetical protein